MHFIPPRSLLCTCKENLTYSQFQELLALSTALSATLMAQIGFESSKQLKHCSTYNLAEGIDEKDKSRAIYQMASEEYELGVTPKKRSPCFFCWKGIGSCLTKCQDHLEAFVDHNIFQRFILSCILINTFSMGIEFHNQVIKWQVFKIK